MLCVSLGDSKRPISGVYQVFLFHFLHSLQILRSSLQTETLKITGSSILFLLVIIEQNIACTKTDTHKVSLGLPLSGRSVHKSWINCQTRNPSSQTVVDLFIITEEELYRKNVYYENYI